MKNIDWPYADVDHPETIDSEFRLNDHLSGFDHNYNNVFLSKLQNYASATDTRYKIEYHGIIDVRIKQLYPNLDIWFNPKFQEQSNFKYFHNYHEHPYVNYNHFICSFNGSPHVSRKLLVSILHRFDWFSSETCSKNFSYTTNIVDGHIEELINNSSFYRKFFISDTKSEEFFTSINSFGLEQYDHSRNIYNLENKLTSSFLHIVSETLATSYYPFVTEKFLYSVVTRGLFLAYAQPGWHSHLEKYYGFKKYDRIFDYRFDSIKNPIERLVELMSMISKFSILSSDDWRDLYEIESETIEYNYDWYFSKQYIRHLEQFSS